jgi:cytochrome c oxidase subunit 2
MFLFVTMALLGATLSGLARSGNGILEVQQIQVTAKKYEFSPNPIRVKKGEPVKLTITATDRDHGFQIDAFHIKQRLKKGEPTVIEFTPEKAGSFPFKCSVFCGFGHGGMKGTIIVEE